MQAAVIEYARNVCGIKDAHSAEFTDDQYSTKTEVIIFMPEGDKKKMGGTMRLGSRDTILKKGTLALKVYKNQNIISERHRHRYEVCPKIVKTLEEKGLVFSGTNQDIDINGERMEIVELPELRYFLAV